jgi:hypothetical protein
LGLGISNNHFEIVIINYGSKKFYNTCSVVPLIIGFNAQESAFIAPSLMTSLVRRKSKLEDFFRVGGKTKDMVTSLDFSQSGSRCSLAVEGEKINEKQERTWFLSSGKL